jgi:hypothetical protein
MYYFCAQTHPEMSTERASPTGVVAAIGGAGAAIGASAATVIETDPVIGFILAFSAGLVIGGGLVLLYTQLV